MSDFINKEYQKLFGITHRPTLFDSSDEEYAKLRCEIILSPRITYNKEILPFEGIEIIPRIPSVDSIPNEVVVDNPLSRLVNSLLQVKEKREPEVIVTPGLDRKIYWMEIEGRCKAYGYVAKGENSIIGTEFYIGANSLISIKDDATYIDTPSYRRRHSIINKYGIVKNGYIQLTQEVKCKSLLSATWYVAGTKASAALWSEHDQKTLFE